MAAQVRGDEPGRGASGGARAGGRSTLGPLAATDPDGPAGIQPPAPPGGGTEREREGDVGIQERERTRRPERWKVVLYNDDYTPMEFVVALLEQVFGKPPTEATQIMLRIHRGGKGVAGVYILEVAETKVSTVHRLAEERGYPLRAGVEKE